LVIRFSRGFGIVNKVLFFLNFSEGFFIFLFFRWEIESLILLKDSQTRMVILKKIFQKFENVSE
jgi:hypothetical protein